MGFALCKRPHHEITGNEQYNKWRTYQLTPFTQDSPNKSLKQDSTRGSTIGHDGCQCEDWCLKIAIFNHLGYHKSKAIQAFLAKGDLIYYLIATLSSE